MIVVQRFTTAELSTCMYFDSSSQLPHQRLWDVRQHAGVLVCPPYANRPFAIFPLPQFAARRMIPTQLPILRPALPSRNLTPGPHSNPIGPRPPRQWLPPSLLIENASDPVFRTRHLSCPRRFRSRLATSRPGESHNFPEHSGNVREGGLGDSPLFKAVLQVRGVAWQDRIGLSRFAVTAITALMVEAVHSLASEARQWLLKHSPGVASCGFYPLH